MKIKVFVIISFYLSIQIGCFSQSKRKSGDDYFKVGTFDRAIKSYERELKRNKNNIALHKKIAISYLSSNIDRSKAIPHVEKILEKNHTPEWVLRYGISLFYAMQLESAMEQFEWVLKNSDKESDEYNSAKEFKNWGLNAQAYIENPVDIDFINLGSKINTKKSELNPFISIDEDMLVYSSNKKYHSSVGINYHNICVSERDGQKWQKAKTIGSYVNSGYDEMVAGLSPNGKSLFVFHNREGDEQVAFADYKGNYRFSIMQNFGNTINRSGGEYGVWLSEEKDTLIYAAENIEGNTDLFYSLKLPNGEYGESRLLPGIVNSNKEENFPVLTDGGKRLYFSSNSNLSMGGYDLFYSDWNEELKEWSNPVNLGYPINDVYDNYSISLTQDQRYGYVSAVKPNGFGERDIYKIVFNQQEPTDIIYQCKTVLKTDTGLIAPPFKIQVILRDSITNNMVGEYNCTIDSSKFVLAVPPGIYMVNFHQNSEFLHSESLKVEEMWYNSIPFTKQFVIPKQSEEKEIE